MPPRTTSTTARGVIGVYDATDGFRRIGEFDTYGIGPHEMLLTPDGDDAGGRQWRHRDPPRLRPRRAQPRHHGSRRCRFVDARSGQPHRPAPPRRRFAPAFDPPHGVRCQGAGVVRLPVPRRGSEPAATRRLCHARRRHPAHRAARRHAGRPAQLCRLGRRLARRLDDRGLLAGGQYGAGDRCAEREPGDDAAAGGRVRHRAQTERGSWPRAGRGCSKASPARRRRSSSSTSTSTIT